MISVYGLLVVQQALVVIRGKRVSIFQLNSTPLLFISSITDPLSPLRRPKSSCQSSLHPCTAISSNSSPCILALYQSIYPSIQLEKRSWNPRIGWMKTRWGPISSFLTFLLFLSLSLWFQIREAPSYLLPITEHSLDPHFWGPFSHLSAFSL